MSKNTSTFLREIDGFIAAWNTLRGDHRMPIKSEIDLRPLQRFLTNVMITEFDGVDMRYRLVGSALEATSRVQVGSSMMEHYPGAVTDLGRVMFKAAYDRPAGFGAEYRVELETGARVTRHSIYLPMSEPGRQEAYFLAYVHFAEEKIYTPLSRNRIQVRSREFSLRCFRFHDLGSGIPEIDPDLRLRASPYFTTANDDED